MNSTPETKLSVLVIEPSKGVFNLNFRELYAYRELLWTLTYRDLRVRYAQTVIGALWALLNPLFTLLILAFVFGVVAKVDTGQNAAGQPIPHLLYTVAGMAGWAYFASLFSEAGTSIIGAQGMVKKIYFPRLIIPLSKAATAFIDFAIVLGFMVVLMIYYGFSPTANFVFFPLFVIIAIVSGLAGGIWMSALTIRFRDFQHVTPFILRLGMYATPIAYPAAAVPEKYQILFYFNPMAGVVEGMRWSLLGGAPLHWYSYISFAAIALMLLLGLFYFKKVEKIMADIL
jgi:lipopolysaccharide transport system permease protein